MLSMPAHRNSYRLKVFKINAWEQSNSRYFIFRKIKKKHTHTHIKIRSIPFPNVPMLRMEKMQLARLARLAPCGGKSPRCRDPNFQSTHELLECQTSLRRRSTCGLIMAEVHSTMHYMGKKPYQMPHVFTSLLLNMIAYTLHEQSLDTYRMQMSYACYLTAGGFNMFNWRDATNQKESLLPL